MLRLIFKVYSSSGLDGIKILIELNNTPSITDPVTLIVGGDALRIVLGADELLAESDIFYEKTFGVIVIVLIKAGASHLLFFCLFFVDKTTNYSNSSVTCLNDTASTPSLNARFSPR